jgi:hypothetical protein
MNNTTFTFNRIIAEITREINKCDDRIIGIAISPEMFKYLINTMSNHTADSNTTANFCNIPLRPSKYLWEGKICLILGQ